MLLKSIGRFFVCNVLVIDRFHVKLKKMASGSKHAMQSLCNNLNTFYSAQHWAMKKSLYPHLPPQGSELAKGKEIPKYESVTQALGSNHRDDVLSSEELNDLYKVYMCTLCTLLHTLNNNFPQAYTIVDEDFGDAWSKYTTYVRANDDRPLSLRDWAQEASNITNAQKTKCKMSRKVKVPLTFICFTYP